ncbi:MAG: glycosyltransferase family 4 protein [Fimbriimonadaceae bacterium]|nr:glycosyltransferase family 4 protein [Chthonomonadaceae bacterium]MCO5295372.1 glycosyltransferase family 4 protein [Fimbriimonadaceae bacterium]
MARPAPSDRLKIAQVGSSLFDWGGIERYVAYLSQGLAARGHDVDVWCPAESPLAQRATVAVRPSALRGQFRFDRIGGFVRLFRKGRYDVAHIHFSPDFIVPALAARLQRVPLVVMTRHVALPWSPSKVRRYLRLFDHIIPVSDAVERRLHESGVPASRMTVAKAGCEPLRPKVGREAAREALGIAEGDFAAGVFGRLVKEKGVDVLLRAQSVPDHVRYEVFGEGPELDSLRREAGPRTTFRGFVPDVADAMNAMDAIVLPSVWEEAFPYAALEAMSLGRALVASRIGGLPEVVVDGETGLLFDPGSSPMLASCLTRLAGDADLVARLGAAGLASHRATYELGHMAERIERVYFANLER